MTDAASSIDDADNNAPRRYIFNDADMEHFRHSSARKELVSFVAAMGRGITSSATTTSSNGAGNPQLPRHHGSYRPEYPLENLSPALASLHGALTCISSTWMDPNHDGIPPDHTVKARFGNPSFRTWHARLVERSYGILRCLMDCHAKHSLSEGNGEVIDESAKLEILIKCSKQGYRAASKEGLALWQPDDTSATDTSKQEKIIRELQAYLHDSFGHPVRIDYGTGHESSFVVFLLSLCKIGCFLWRSKDRDGKSPVNPPSHQVIGIASLSLFHAYLQVTRGLQRDYMLEPAGSHGVWGLDDYHCIPFYLGACQMVAREQWQQEYRVQAKKKSLSQDGTTGSNTNNDEDTDNKIPDNPYLPESASHVLDPSASTDTHTDNHDHWTPSIIHNNQVLETYSPTYLYLSCIQFIRQIKPNVPFFESSPMLNDISHLGSWSKASSGLLRLYEGEVLDKKPVVQHFVFGQIFNASWSPSRTAPLEAPTRTFINGPMGEECISPWAYSSGEEDSSRLPPPSPSHSGGMPPTRAPWANLLQSPPRRLTVSFLPTAKTSPQTHAQHKHSIVSRISQTFNSIGAMSSPANKSSDSTTNDTVDGKAPEDVVAEENSVGIATEKEMTPEESAEAAKVRMKAHVLLAKVEQSEAKRSPSLANTPRESTADLSQNVDEATATATVEAAVGTVEESTASDETAAAAAASKNDVDEDEAATLAEAKLKKEKEIEDKKNESSEELTRRLQKLALERQKETRHERLKVIQSDQTSHLSSAKTFQELKLPEHLLKALFEMGFERPSAIQEEALPRMLANPPRNVIGQAQSGSGKTAAFVLGMLFRIKIDKPASCQALCVTPTRELAVQIFQNAVTPMATHMVGLRVRLALAGEQLERGDKVDAHIVIGTPGKVVDWLKRRMINTKYIKVLVLDEADNLVAESGHRANSQLINGQMPKACQRLLFSATFPDEVIAFAEKLVYNPDKILIESGPEFLVLDVIKQLWIDCQQYEGGKLQFLEDIYSLLTIGQSIIFVGTKRDADSVHHTLSDSGYTCSLLHSGVDNDERDRTMEAFRKMESNVLITTNVLARGVDVDNVCLVVNYDVPVDKDGQPDYETYLHRIGRTGRFGRKGTAINLISDQKSIEVLASIEAHFSSDGKEMIQMAPPDPEALAGVIEI